MEDRTKHKLNTSLQSGKERVHVSLRVRPLFDTEIQTNGEDTILQYEGKQKIVLSAPNDQTRPYHFDEVFSNETSQDFVFEKIGIPVTDDIISGLDGTIMAYGQTAMGILNFSKHEERGLIIRCLERVFDHVAQERVHHPNISWTCKISFVQIYNENVQDLLNPSSGNLTIFESSKNGVTVPGLHFDVVNSIQEASDSLVKGLRNRIVAPTLMNTTSSRAHTLLTFEVIKRSQTRESRTTLRLVDLAGSERVNRTFSSGMRLEEAKYINKSLSVLGQVISSLSGNQSHSHIPYRDSKLTRLLKEVLKGNTCTYLVATISPARDSYFETLSTIQFAQRCMNIKVNARVHEKDIIDYKELSKQLQKQIQEMQSKEYKEEHMKYLIESEPPVPNNVTNSIDSNDIIVSQLARDLKMSWNLVHALYETLWEIYNVSLFNLETLISRSNDAEDSWTKIVAEEKNLALKEALNEVLSKYPIQLLKNNFFQELDELRDVNIQKRGPLEYENIEGFVADIASLHRTILSQQLCQARVSEMREMEANEMRRDIANFVNLDLLRDRELQSYNEIIKDLVANAAQQEAPVAKPATVAKPSVTTPSKSSIATPSKPNQPLTQVKLATSITSSVQMPPKNTTIPNQSVQKTKEDSIATALHCNKCATIIQRCYRNYRKKQKTKQYKTMLEKVKLQAQSNHKIILSTKPKLKPQVSFDSDSESDTD